MELSFRTRRIAACCALLALAESASGYGLGDMTTLSSPNEPLQAEIALLGVRAGDMGRSEFQLASRKLFDRAGIVWSAELSTLSFQPAKRDKTYVLEVTSPQPLATQPLAFMLQAVWDKKRLVREYTLFPQAVSEIIFDDETVTGVVFEPAFESDETQPATAATAPQPTNTIELSSESENIAGADASMEKNIGPPLYSVENLPENSLETGKNIGSPLYPLGDEQEGEQEEKQQQEYVVRKGDTIIQIARNTVAAESLSQAMLAYKRLNPRAFSRNNVNGLMAGYVLRVPEPEEIERLSVAQALAEMRRQNAEWISSRQELAQQKLLPENTAASGATGSAGLSGEASRLEIAGSVGDATSFSNAVGDENNEETIRAEISVLRELSESRAKEAEELHSKIADLESMIVKMDRIIDLQNGQLAQLQQLADEELDSPRQTARQTIVSARATGLGGIVEKLITWFKANSFAVLVAFVVLACFNGLFAAWRRFNRRPSNDSREDSIEDSIEDEFPALFRPETI